ncbi:hypothetical protein F2Q70_00044850 [Brassica cretica]|uniref:Uncharacterized protein n=1 Tax=Brassica cretica TaxID=69181 RepID=A0A8S9KJ96_BRACR|nr:hypothetical protein F2Q70_00044850 [Brassica cretica]
MQDSPEDAPLSPHQPPSPLPNATVAIPGREAAVRLDDCLKYCIVAGKKALESSGLGVLASRIICSSDEYWFKAGLVDLVVFPWFLLVKSSFPSPSVLESCSSHMCGVSRFLLLHLYLRRVLLCCFKRFLATSLGKVLVLARDFSASSGVLVLVLRFQPSNKWFC